MLLANAIALQRLGTPEDEVIGQYTLDILPSELIRARLAHIRQVVDTGQPLEFDDERAGIQFHHCFNPVFAADGRVEAIARFSRDITERKKAEALIKQQREELRGLAMQLSLVQESERSRIARELHDRIGQQLTALSFKLSMIADQLPDETSSNVQTLLDSSLALIETTGESVRDVMADLRPPALDDYGLAAALRHHCERVAHYTSTLFHVQECPREIRLSSDKEIAFFRIAQEALMNVVQHARATHVNISLTAHEPRVSLVITDNGVGFDLQAPVRLRGKPGWGLLSMRERADAIGGRLTISSTPGAGTTIAIEVEQ